MRTKEEVQVQLTKGKKFITEHPTSIFGTDNVAQYELFQKVVEQFQQGVSEDELLDGTELLDDDDQLLAMGIIDWLFEYADDSPYG